MNATTEIEVRAPNSLVLVGDPSGEPPASMAGGLVAATTSCIAVGTLASDDGPTRVRLIDAEFGADLPPLLAFDGLVDLPGNRLVVTSVLDEIYLEHAVAEAALVVQIWVNHPNEPDQIVVLTRGAPA